MSKTPNEIAESLEWSDFETDAEHKTMVINVRNRSNLRLLADWLEELMSGRGGYDLDQRIHASPEHTFLDPICFLEMAFERVEDMKDIVAALTSATEASVRAKSPQWRAAYLALFAALKVAREAQATSQETLADRLGVHMRTLRRWENGEGDPPAQMLFRWAAALGVTIGANLPHRSGA